MKNFLETKIGDNKRYVTVKNINLKEILLKDNKESKKIEFQVTDENNRNYEISDVWLHNPQKGFYIAGLWYKLDTKGGIDKSSSLSSLLKYYNACSLKCLIGKKLLVKPDNKNYLTIVACNKI